jgi:hypothetical protein
MKRETPLEKIRRRIPILIEEDKENLISIALSIFLHETKDKNLLQNVIDEFKLENFQLL